jgi:hypothetical protein
MLKNKSGYFREACADINSGFHTLVEPLYKSLPSIIANYGESPYMVRQFNSRNGLVKDKFTYLYTNGCCFFQKSLLVKLCTS